jgi:hypothetical protein
MSHDVDSNLLVEHGRNNSPCTDEVELGYRLALSEYSLNPTS